LHAVSVYLPPIGTTFVRPIAWGIYVWRHPSFTCLYRFPPVILLFSLCHKANTCRLRPSLFSMDPELEDIYFFLLEEGWAPKNWCFLTVVLEKTLESPLDCKEIQPVHSEGDQPWDFFGRNDAKAATPVLWPPHVKSWLIGKASDAGRDWGQEEQGTTEAEMAGWASLTRWTWVWVNSGSWWWTGRPGVLRFMGLQRVGHDWANELNWTEPISILVYLHRILIIEEHFSLKYLIFSSRHLMFLHIFYVFISFRRKTLYFSAYVLHIYFSFRSFLAFYTMLLW